MPGHLKAVVLCVVLVGYVALIELVSYVVAWRFSALHGN